MKIEGRESDYNNIVLSGGTVKVTTLHYTKNHAGKPKTETIAKNLTVTINGSNDKCLNKVIYGQSITTDVSFTDSGKDGWNAIIKYISDNKLNRIVFETIKSLIVGEIANGFVFGFVNSKEKPNGEKTAIKDMPSYKWWALSPNDGYSKAQPTGRYYDTYAAIINEFSNNQIYGAAYGDRFTHPKENPTFETSFYRTSIPVCSMIVTLEPPISLYPIKK